MAKNDFKATLPDGRVIEAQSDTELRKQIEKEYGSYKSNWTWTSNDNGFTYKVYTPQSDDRLYNDIFQSSLPEVVVTAKGTPKQEKSKPKQKPAQKSKTTTSEPKKSIIDVQQGRNASERVDEASAQLGTNPLNWPRNAGLYAGGRNANYWNSDIHKAVKEGGDIAAIVAASPLVAYGAAEYAIPWAAENLLPYMSANGWLQATQATGTTPWWLTPTTATAIDATLAGSATGASIYDMYKNGPSVENVTGTALGLGGLAFEAAPTIMELYDSGKTAYNTYRLSRAMNNAAKTSDIPPELKPFITDFKFGKGSGMVVRADKGDGKGLFTGNGSYIKDGFLHPGQTRVDGQRNFTWWNEDEVFSPGFKMRPHPRVFIARQSDIPGLQRVRSMNEPVGQWRPGSRAFVRQSEMVTPEPTDVTNLTQFNYDSNLGTYVRSDIPTHNRFRLGEVEIDDPFNNYRMLRPGGADNFIRTGRQYSPDYVDWNYVEELRESMSLKDWLKTPWANYHGEYPNPMYSRSRLWYQPSPENPDLLVTRQPMYVANQRARKIAGSPEDLTEVRRIPVNPENQNLSNTGVYTWDPNYYGPGRGGYVRRRGTKPMMGLYERPKSRLTDAERAGIPKGERAAYNPEVMDNAKKFAQKYGYDEPTTIDEAKDMYRRHNTFFRTVFDSFLEPVPGLPHTPTQTELYLQSLPREQRLQVLASKGYPTYHRAYGTEEGFSDPFVFVTPGNASQNSYVTGKYPAVMLRRPFSLRDPLKWHTNAEWAPISEYERTSFPRGTVQIGNSGPAHELKVSTENLYPVRIATGDDVGTNGGLFFQNVFDKDNPLHLQLNEFFKNYKPE